MGIIWYGGGNRVNNNVYKLFNVTSVHNIPLEPFGHSQKKEFQKQKLFNPSSFMIHVCKQTPLASVISIDLIAMHVNPLLLCSSFDIAI